MPSMTTTEIEKRKSVAEFYAPGYRAASVAKGCMLTEQEMIQVRRDMNAGITPEEIGIKFTPPPQPIQQSTRQILDAFSQTAAGLREDLERLNHNIQQLEKDLTIQGHAVRQLQEEVVALKRQKKS